MTDAAIPSVPYDADERASLLASLGRQRAVVRWKVAGVEESSARRAMVPSGTSVLGLVKHLGSVEYGWFCATFGRPADAVEFDEADPDADLRARDDESASDILAYYDRATAAADASIARHDLADTGMSSSGRVVTMRWVILHMIEETSRHAGHLDILCELIDGRTGDYPGS